VNRPLRLFGIGAAIGGGVVLLVAIFVAALLIGPFVFWLAWNVLDFGPNIGLPELGFWSIVLATLFLIVGWVGKSLIALIVFVVEPSWLDGVARVTWPEPTVANFVAIVLLAILASRPHAHAHKSVATASPGRSAKESGPWTQVAGEFRAAFSSAVEKKRRGPAT
jgi:hypothetical protein